MLALIERGGRQKGVNCNEFRPVTLWPRRVASQGILFSYGNRA